MITATAILTETISVTAVLFGTNGVILPPVMVRSDYSQFLIYTGWGPASATDSTPLTIERITIDPVDGSVTEDYSTNPWTNFADGPWSPTPP